MRDEQVPIPPSPRHTPSTMRPFSAWALVAFFGRLPDAEPFTKHRDRSAFGYYCPNVWHGCPWHCYEPRALYQIIDNTPLRGIRIHPVVTGFGFGYADPPADVGRPPLSTRHCPAGAPSRRRRCCRQRSRRSGRIAETGTSRRGGGRRHPGRVRRSHPLSAIATKWTVTRTFHVPEDTTKQDLVNTVNASAHTYLGIPGLIRKYYGIAEDGETLVGIYLWKSK